MASNKIIESKHRGYVIRIRELVEHIREIESRSSSYSNTIQVFPREHLSIQKPDGGFLKDKEISRLIKKGIDSF